MPLVEYTCPKCQMKIEELTPWPFAKTKPCPYIVADTPCEGTMVLGMGIIKSYKISGNNSASVTPKKFRGES